MLPLRPGIYKITNIKNGKFYIGSASNIRYRWTAHKSSLRRNLHGNFRLQRSWNKYGNDAFKCEVIEEIEDKSALFYREQFWMDKLINDKSNCYNLLPSAGCNLGFKHSEETKKKIGKAHVGMKRSDATRENISKAIKGRSRNLSPEQRKAIGDRWRGRKMSDEQKKKISESKIGKKRPKEHCEIMALAQKKRFMEQGVSLETRMKLSASLKGRKFSEDHRKKLTAANLRRWEKKRREPETASLPKSVYCK